MLLGPIYLGSQVNKGEEEKPSGNVRLQEFVG